MGAHRGHSPAGYGRTSTPPRRRCSIPDRTLASGLPVPHEVLMRVARPARYLDAEPNAVHKEHSPGLVKFVLCYPDVYDVGMSNMGLSLLYHVLNERSDALAERVFAPWPDMEAEMRGLGLPLFALESGRPVREFEFLGFSLQYELTFTNVLNLLDLARIPLFAADRGDGDPLVIGGGPCAFNPEPLAPFFDLFFLGEGEEGVGELVEAYSTWHRHLTAVPGGPTPGPGANGGRLEVLEALARVPGVYVPAFYDVAYNPDGTVGSIRPNRAGVPETVVKRVVADLSRHPIPPAPVVPFIETVHDRAAIEVMRGCARGCRFCQAGMVYRPVRERTGDEVLDGARAVLANTGYEEVSLASLSTCDWGPVADTIRDLVAEHGPGGVAVSLPSLRTDTFAVDLASKIREVRKTGLTFAPEAATARLRAVVNKGVTRDDLLEAARAAFRAGWDRLKLYYMVGLPTETDEDLEGIGEEAWEVRRVYEDRGEGTMATRRPLAMTISLATFIPKAHTPFQWQAQVTVEEAGRRIEVVRQNLHGSERAGSRGKRRPGIKVDWHDPEMSRLEAVLARGDRRLHAVILEAWRRGALFDSWREFFRPAAWEEAFRATGLDPAFYANRERSEDEVFPWDHLSSGVETRFLARERRKALAAEPTPDCRWSPCTGCGVCDATASDNLLAARAAQGLEGPAGGGRDP
ncbi:MAG: TIGR03960 family B12-binding radical SAM protein [Bacillota bacterium]|nr:MAG: TIGR03960 family B12-binding radical SAM protein [Bacillota bacterium]